MWKEFKYIKNLWSLLSLHAIYRHRKCNSPDAFFRHFTELHIRPSIVGRTPNESKIVIILLKLPQPIITKLIYIIYNGIHLSEVLWSKIDFVITNLSQFWIWTMHFFVNLFSTKWPMLLTSKSFHRNNLNEKYKKNGWVLN